MLTSNWGKYSIAGSCTEEEIDIAARLGDDGKVWLAYPVEGGCKILELSGISDITDDADMWQQHMNKLMDDTSQEYDVMVSGSVGTNRFLMAIDSMDSISTRGDEVNVEIEQEFEFTDGEFEDKDYEEVFSLLNLV